jgi:hypothetical protein
MYFANSISLSSWCHNLADVKQTIPMASRAEATIPLRRGALTAISCQCRVEFWPSDKEEVGHTLEHALEQYCSSIQLQDVSSDLTVSLQDTQSVEAAQSASLAYSISWSAQISAMVQCYSANNVVVWKQLTPLSPCVTRTIQTSGRKYSPRTQASQPSSVRQSTLVVAVPHSSQGFLQEG